MTLPINNNEVWVQIEDYYLHQENDPDIKEGPYCGCIDHRHGQNGFRVSVAGGLSMVGGWLAGFAPTTVGIAAGAIFSAVGNGASTFLTWKTKDKAIIEARIMTDLPKVTSRINAFDDKLSILCERVSEIYSETITEKQEDVDALFERLKIEPKSLPCCWNGRFRRNFLRLFIAGGFSAAGGWLGGYVPTIAGITVGGFLGGFGNGLSTWLAYEKKNDILTKDDALEILPKLVKIMKKSEKSLIDTINRIKNLHPEMLLDLDLESAENPEEVSGENIDIESGEAAHSEDDPQPCLSAKKVKNMAYVATAGVLSGIGGAVAGYFPNDAGIITGGLLGGLANSISTWLAWEGKNDSEVNRRIIEDFPNLVIRVAAINSKVHTLKKIFEDVSSDYSTRSEES